MKIEFKKGDILKHKTKVLIYGCIEGELDNTMKALDTALNGTIKNAFKDKSFTGKKNKLKVITTHGKLPFEYLILTGLGKTDEITSDTIRQGAGTGCRGALPLMAEEISIAMPDDVYSKCGAETAAQAIALGGYLSLYSFNIHKTKDKDEKIEIKIITLISDSKGLDINGITRGIDTALKIGDAVYFAKDMVSEPGNYATPSYLADKAKGISSKGSKIKCTILEKPEISKLKMGSFLGVARGSDEPPRFIILEYNGAGKNESPYVLIGKGITFDSGGISIKPSKGMEDMKYDMAGGAAVMGAIKAAAAISLPLNVVALIPATENMPDGKAAKPGDILKSMSGQTIEIISTDAEGRLILADALTYAERYKPKAVIDIATLTGACVIALGNFASGLLGNDKELIEDLKNAGEACGERVWELPLWDEYSDAIKSDIADMKNTGDGTAGTISGAAFLKKFSSNFKWAHIDIAGTAWKDKNGSYIPKGASGFGVRLLLQYLIDQTKNGKR